MSKLNMKSIRIERKILKIKAEEFKKYFLIYQLHLRLSIKIQSRLVNPQSLIVNTLVPNKTGSDYLIRIKNFFKRSFKSKNFIEKY